MKYSCYNRDTGKFEYTAQYNGIKHCKSELACKQWITKQSGIPSPYKYLGTANKVVADIERAKLENNTLITYSKDIAPGVYYARKYELNHIVRMTNWAWEKQEDYISFYDENY